MAKFTMENDQPAKRREDVQAADEAFRQAAERKNSGTEDVLPALMEHLDNEPEHDAEGYPIPTRDVVVADDARARLHETGDFDDATAAFAEMLAEVNGDVDAFDTPEDGDDADAPEDDAEDADEDADEADEVDLTQTKHKVKVRGEEYEVEYAELVNGYQRNADYTRSKQEVAAQRKEVEALHSKVVADATQYATGLATITQFMEQHLTPQAQQAIQAQMNEAIQSISAARDYELERTVERESKKAAEMLGWTDDTVARKAKSEMIRVAQNDYGFSAAELSEVVDARLLVVLHDAVQWRNLKSGNQEALRSTRKKGRTLEPGNHNSPRTSSKARNAKAARARARASGSIHDFADSVIAAGLLDD
jgi:hypothetical protein